MTAEKIKQLIQQMTLEEKASLCSGADFWHTQGIERLGIPEMMMSDGPHGLRKQDDKADHLGVNESIRAVCFPAGCGAATSFNRELMTEIGRTIGEECQAEGVGVILGPSVNIKRSPLCGRNFEYYSEDPVVASQMAAAFIKGVQSRNVGTSIKHFLANNQETRRMSVSAEIDVRTLHEIYLAAFEGAVREQKPWTAMCSYNRINGVYAAENRKYLTDTLRGEWGFDGFTVSDWGAVNDRPKDLAAGLDLEMPSSGGINDRELVKAVQNGALKEETLDTAAERILNIVFRYEENRDKNAVFDRDRDHEKARRAAEETIVLLKNEKILPLCEKQNIAFIGQYAERPRYQGGGSSHINSHKVTSALDMAAGNPNIRYARGFDGEEDEADGKLLDEALEAAKNADVAVIFAGLPESFESEGFDRSHMRLPDCQNLLIERVAEVQPNVVVVLHNGSPVEMPWISRVKGVLEAYLGGQAVGGAVYDILLGRVNPSAKLAETFPLKLEDNPSYLSFPGEGDRAEYSEGIFVGYRYYDRKKMEVLFPFGHGLSYTTFEYSNLRMSAERISDADTVTVSVDVTNTGEREGKEIVQLYVRDRKSTVIRPEKELKDFAKTDLRPGETKTLEFTLGKRAFAYYNTDIGGWHVETGEFDLLIARSSRDIVLKKTITVESTEKLPVRYTADSIMEDIDRDPAARRLVKELMAKSMAFAEAEQTSGNTPEDGEKSAAAEAITAKMQEAMMRYMPLRGAISFGGETTGISAEDVRALVERLNALPRK